MAPGPNLNALRWLVILQKNDWNETRAAKEIGSSQPAVSQRIATLRKDFGDEIIIRDQHGVRLTRAGKILCEAAENALGLINLAQQRIKVLGRANAPDERLHIACSPSHMVTVMNTLAEALPEREGLRVTITEANPDTVFQLLNQKDGPDLGVAYFPESARRALGGMVLPSKPLALVTNKLLNPHLAALAKIRPQDLTQTDLALLEKGPVRRIINGYFRRHRPKRIILESNTVASLLEAVRSGVASTILPEFPEDGTLAVRRLDPLVKPTAFVLLKKHRASETAVLFARSLMFVAHDLKAIMAELEKRHRSDT